MTSVNIKYWLGFILSILLQVTLFKDIALFNYGFCFIYLMYLLGFPIETRPAFLLIIGFGAGLFVDMFYNTGGIHAFSCVLILFLRDKWLNLITPQGGYDSHNNLTVRLAGFGWFAGYAFPLILLHHIVLFFVESYGFSYFWHTLGKSFFSACFTFMVIVLVQQLFFSVKRG